MTKIVLSKKVLQTIAAVLVLGGGASLALYGIRLSVLEPRTEFRASVAMTCIGFGGLLFFSGCFIPVAQRMFGKIFGWVASKFEITE